MRLRYEGPVYGIRARGLDPYQEPHTRVEAMAEYYIDHIRLEQPNGPYALVGHSFGGLFAFEMARRLRLAGDEVSFLGLIDTDVHEGCLPIRLRVRFEAWRFVRRVRETALEPEKKLLPLVRERAKRALPWLPIRDGTEPVLPSLSRVTDGAHEAFKAYRPSPYGGTAILFRAAIRRKEFCDALPVWSRVVEGGLSVRRVTGTHADLFRGQQLEELVHLLDASLPSAQPDAG